MEPKAKTNFLVHFAPAIIVLVAVLLRVLYFAEIIHSPTFSHPVYDPEYNSYWAKGIATGDWTIPPGVNDPEITSTPHGRPPGYPWFLSVIYMLFGVNDYIPRIVQMILGVINALLLYVLGKHIFGNAVGFTAGLLMATYWVFPYFEGILTYPALAVFLVLCLFLILERWIQTQSLLKIAAAGALLGCFALLRPNALLFAPVLATWMAWLLWRTQEKAGKIILTLLILVLSCITILIPGFVRNYLVARDFVFISAYGGINLYVGNHPEASLVEPRIPELVELAGIENWTCFDYPAIVHGLAQKEGWEKASFSKANHYFYRKAFDFIKNDPALFLKNLFLKALLFWGPHEITNDTVMEYDKQFSHVLHLLPGFPWFGALFIFGSLIVAFYPASPPAIPCQKQRTMIVLLWLFIASYSFSVIIYFVAGRYRIPILPIMLLFGAVGIVWLINAILTRRYAAAVTGALVLLCLFTVFHLNPTGYMPNPGTWHLRTALAYTAAGDTVQAEREYLTALEYKHNSPVIYTNLARLHIARGDTEGGIELYREGLRHNPRDYTIHNNLGYELYQQGNFEDAVHHFQQAIAINPKFALAHINLGNLLLDMGKPDNAARVFEQACTIEPNNPVAYYNTARAYAETGDYTQAIQGYKQAIALKQDFAEALNNLGYIYASLQQYDTAISFYEKAIAANPDFLLAYNNLGNAYFDIGRLDDAAIAYNRALARNDRHLYAYYNLSRVYAAQKRFPEAIDALKKALELNPEYVPALQLLAEILLITGQVGEAVLLLDTAAELSPDNIDILLLKGDAQECSGDMLEALRTYDTVVGILRDGKKTDK